MMCFNNDSFFVCHGAWTSSVFFSSFFSFFFFCTAKTFMFFSFYTFVVSFISFPLFFLFALIEDFAGNKISSSVMTSWRKSVISVAIISFSFSFPSFFFLFVVPLVVASLVPMHTMCTSNSPQFFAKPISFFRSFRSLFLSSHFSICALCANRCCLNIDDGKALLYWLHYIFWFLYIQC